jgi:hypothetical protein
MLIERMQFFNGQRLFAADLQDLDDFNRQMRWLHNQSLHGPGVGSGYAISGPKGERQVVIQPGYAIDNLGREIVLTDTLIEPVPPVANDGNGNPVIFDLCVSYPAASDLVETETREGVCVTAGAVRLREAPVFCWINVNQATPAVRQSLNIGERIRLGRAEVLNCQLNSPISLAQRRNARPATRPYITSGSTDSSGWSPPNVSTFGIELIHLVDTSTACFRATPCYTARISGDRHFKLTIGGLSSDFILDGFVSVVQTGAAQPSPTGFQVQVLIPSTLLELNGKPVVELVAAVLPDALIANQWAIQWMGVED